MTTQPTPKGAWRITFLLFLILTMLSLAQYWNMLAGFAGLVSIGQQAFVGLGAYAMFALGEPVDAATAVAWGLANAVVPASELRGRARAAAQALTQRPAGSLAHTKALMREFEKIAAQINREGEIFAERLGTAEAREAFTAFAERRKPDFSKVG